MTVAPAVKWMSLHTELRWIISDNFKRPDWSCLHLRFLLSFFFLPSCCVVINTAAPIISSGVCRSVDMSDAWIQRLSFTRWHIQIDVLWKRKRRWSWCGVLLQLVWTLSDIRGSRCVIREVPGCQTGVCVAKQDPKASNGLWYNRCQSLIHVAKAIYLPLPIIFAPWQHCAQDQSAAETVSLTQISRNRRIMTHSCLIVQKLICVMLHEPAAAEGVCVGGGVIKRVEEGGAGGLRRGKEVQCCVSAPHRCYQIGSHPKDQHIQIEK